MAYDITKTWASIEQRLEKHGEERNRTNFLRWMYVDLPADWDDEDEEQLPPDLRLIPAPLTPLPH